MVDHSRVFYGWQKNQNGTYYADYCGSRISVNRSFPRARTFIATINGKRIGVFDGLDSAKIAALHEAEK